MLVVKSKKSKWNRNRVGEDIYSLPDIRQEWLTVVLSTCRQPAYRIWSISITASAQEFNATVCWTVLQDLSARAEGRWSPHSFTGYTCAWMVSSGPWHHLSSGKTLDPSYCCNLTSLTMKLICGGVTIMSPFQLTRVYEGDLVWSPMTPCHCFSSLPAVDWIWLTPMGSYVWIFSHHRVVWFESIRR